MEDVVILPFHQSLSRYLEQKWLNIKVKKLIKSTHHYPVDVNGRDKDETSRADRNTDNHCFLELKDYMCAALAYSGGGRRTFTTSYFSLHHYLFAYPLAPLHPKNKIYWEYIIIIMTPYFFLFEIRCRLLQNTEYALDVRICSFNKQLVGRMKVIPRRW